MNESEQNERFDHLYTLTAEGNGLLRECLAELTSIREAAIALNQWNEGQDARGLMSRADDRREVAANGG